MTDRDRDEYPEISRYERAWSDVMHAAAVAMERIDDGIPWDPSTLDATWHMGRSHLALAIHVIAGMARDLGYNPDGLRLDAARPEINDALRAALGES